MAMGVGRGLIVTIPIHHDTSDEDLIVDLYRAELDGDMARYAELHDEIYGLTYWCYDCQHVIPHPLDYHVRYRCVSCGGIHIAKDADGTTDYGLASWQKYPMTDREYQQEKGIV